jgi:hypothetical protein
MFPSTFEVEVAHTSPSSGCLKERKKRSTSCLELIFIPFGFRSGKLLSEFSWFQTGRLMNGCCP